MGEADVAAFLERARARLDELDVSEAVVRRDETSAPRTDTPRLIVSPYRFNPLGAHVDHQGGRVLARTLDQYTLLAFRADDTPRVTLSFDDGWTGRSARPGDGRADDVAAETPGGADVAALNRAPDTCSFTVDEAGEPVPAPADSRIRFARAATAVLHAHAPLSRGLTGVVHGTLIGAGLSSSASVTLAYLAALADVNGLALDERTLVELVRRVENEHLGLANGVQDQMSIVFGRRGALSLLDVDAVAITPVADPPTDDDVRWLLCYSGVSRELAAGSGFNTRVAECREAAALLHPGASRLGDVPPSGRDEASLAALPEPLGRRARHVFTEMDRVQVGADAWRHGDHRFFGELMDASCRSSIEQYESGSEWLIALHEIARGTPGVLGSRFSGGGYGGCLVMLVERDAVDAAARRVLERYVARYPEHGALARTFVATPERGVRLA